MKNIIILTIVLTMLLALYSCSNDDNVNNSQSIPVDTSVFIFPFDIGNYWNYNSSFTISDIKPDSLVGIINSSPVYGNGKLTITKDTLLNGVSVRQFTNNYNEDSTTFISRIYYIQNDTSLMQYAYSIYSSTNIFPDSKPKLYYKFNGSLFNSPRELLLATEYEMNMNNNDTLIFEDPAPKALIYPIVTGREWVYRNFFTNTINRKYLNFENLTVGNTIVSCIKANLFWSPENFAEVYDYYSKYGKLRHYLFANDVIVSDEFGHELGTIDIKELTNVTTYFVAEIMP